MTKVRRRKAMEIKDKIELLKKICQTKYQIAETTPIKDIETRYQEQAYALATAINVLEDDDFAKDYWKIYMEEEYK